MMNEHEHEHQCGGPAEACMIPGCAECGMPWTLLELVDAAYEQVEVYEPISMAQAVWRGNWLRSARQHGAGPDCFPRQKCASKKL